MHSSSHVEQGHRELGVSPTYRKRRRERLLKASRAGVAARERIRMERVAEAGEWTRVATVVLQVNAAPDGRTVAIRACHGRGEWSVCGSERAVRGRLAGFLWTQRTKGSGR
jgi:hypothetical protein